MISAPAILHCRFLNSFPFDRIKIDGSFIQLTGNNERADAIFKAVVGLGAALRVPVLAEGIETEQQLLFAIDQAARNCRASILAGRSPSTGLRDCGPIWVVG